MMRRATDPIASALFGSHVALSFLVEEGDPEMGMTERRLMLQHDDAEALHRSLGRALRLNARSLKPTAKDGT